MTRFTWTPETVFSGWTLRDEREYARAVVTHRGGVFFGMVFASGLPAEGPYATAAEAATWVCEEIVRQYPHLAGSEFGGMPA